MLASKQLNIHFKEKVVYTSFPHIEATDLVNHGFSTRHGGVSQGFYTAMNLSFTRGDDPDKVRENFTRFANAIGADPNQLVFSDQIHKTVVKQVTIEEAGNGFARPNDFKGIDGLITNEPHLTLTTFYADCVPLFFLDPVHKAIGLSHAGWRGTVGRIGPKTVEAMKTAFTTNPSDLLVGIGPSIGACCYEVTKDVIMEFEKNTKHGIMAKIVQQKDANHWMLDLWEANRQFLIAVGVRPENIVVTDLCTKCFSEDFYSHRVMGTERGSLAAMMALR